MHGQLCKIWKKDGQLSNPSQDSGVQAYTNTFSKKKLDASVYHVNTQEGSPSHFSNESYTLIIIFADNQFVHVIIK